MPAIKDVLSDQGDDCSENSQTISSDDLENNQIISRITEEKGSTNLPTDGGYGWVCCICVTFIMFSTWGSNSAFGVFLGYYLNNGVFVGATKIDYALIAGMTVFFGQGLAPFVITCMNIFGFKPPMILGTILLLLGFVLGSYATQLWQLYLTQGFLFGVGISFVYAPATVVLPGWFLRKRSFAQGISLVGTGAGGVTYSLAVNQMIQRTGDQKWALRVLAITCSVTCMISIAFLREREPTVPSGIRSWTAVKKEFGRIFSSETVKIVSVNLIAAWFMFALFGYTLMIFTLAPYAIARGLTPHQASALTAIMNGAQSCGRPLMGLSGDRFGRTNTTAFLTALIALLLFAFWIPSHTYLQLIFFAICLGMCVGVANVMNTVLVADAAGPSQFLPSWSYINLVGAPFMLVSELIAQVLTDKKHPTNPYIHAQILTGLCFVCALILILILRERTVRLKLINKSETFEEVDENYSDVIDNKKESRCEVQYETGDNYEHLLGTGVGKYFRRMFCPIKV